MGRTPNLALLLMLTAYTQVQAGRIYGGRVAEPHSRPYMALLEKTSTDDHQIPYCDGFLLDEDWVMTAAHCDANPIKVRLGVHDSRKKTSEEIPVEKAHPHPDYHTDYLDFDIMLLKLSQKAVLTDYVQPIPLPSSEDEEMPENCLVSGWGYNDRNVQRGSHVLREVNVTVVHNETCKEYHMLCTSGEDGPGPGDSGGPLVCGEKPFGVVSHTYNGITAYMLVPDFLPWIQSVMSGSGARDKQRIRSQ